MKKIKLIIIFFVVSFSMTFCTKHVDVVSMEQFQSKILDENTVVLDVRTEEEFFGPLGHIDKAILIPIDELENRLEELKKFQDETIYVVCRSGNRSNFGKDLLIENNYNAVNIDGGMLAWKVDYNAR